MFQRSAVSMPKEKLKSIKGGIHSDSAASPEAIVRFLGCPYAIRTIFLEPLGV
ncbi:MAG: hypothetical protein GVY17_05925 [Cyanobacteria bacterium]|jgi:hypothetical protein|nr:hypothetical protein [Cyanobacteria bacterium GSL.Bin21]